MSSHRPKPFEIAGQMSPLKGQMWGPAVESALEKLLALKHLNKLYAAIPRTDNVDAFLCAFADVLGLQYLIARGDLASIPRTGRLVVVANHPFGAIEGIVLTQVLRAVRPDVRFMANFLLARIPELQELIFAVDPFGREGARQRNVAGLRQAREWLECEGCLVIFPAGEVSHLDLAAGAVTDPPWNTTAARLARRSSAPVLPMYFHGGNSALFQLAGLIQPRLRTAMLPRELINKRKSPIALAIGQPIAAAKLAGAGHAQDVTDYLRFCTYMLSAAFPASMPLMQRLGRDASARVSIPVAAAMDNADVAAEIRAIEAADPSRCLVRDGDLSVGLLDSPRAPNVLQEIGRLRELTFRGAGEGTGRSRDIDLYDSYYEHLVLWNTATHEIAGAYRLARTDVVRHRYGLRGLYTQSLFRYDGAFLDRLGKTVELGRSFIRPEYQRSYAALMMLWKGIGHYLVRYRDYTTLFGPVSVSNAYHPLSRALMVEFFKTHHGAAELSTLVQARRPYRSLLRFHGQPHATLPALLDLADVDARIGDLESDGKGIPVLLRHYLKLGGRFAGFHVDTAFGHCVDGLIVVDLRTAPVTTLRRYMGKAAASEFLAAHCVDGERLHIA